MACCLDHCRKCLRECLVNAEREHAWRALPERIIFIRHGQAEHNLEEGAILHEDNPNRKADNLCELTPLGREQGKEAGRRVQALLGDGARVSVVVSPFERTQQTLYCMQQEMRSLEVRCVHVDPRVREQEFGNFQVREDMQLHKATASAVGRFWYRRPTGESSADVYDRAATFWESLLDGALEPSKKFDRNRIGAEADDALVVVTAAATATAIATAIPSTSTTALIPATISTAIITFGPQVTHGLTMRLLLMRYFQWSPQTFDAVYNPGIARWSERAARRG